MILPIVAFGDPVLRKKCKEIEPDYPQLQELIDSMFETMYAAPGVGLAAPQIGKDIRLFVVDSAYVLAKEGGTPDIDEAPVDADNEKDDEFAGEAGIKKAFLNAKILKEYGKRWNYEEGCLSIPGIRDNVQRFDTVVIEYQDEQFNTITEEYKGFTARVIQHEYDHIEGILFTDKLNPIKKRMLKNRLDNITKGLVDVKYKMLFPQKQRGR